MNLTAKATIQIQRPVGEVFEAIVNPEQMTKYFISESTGRLETDKEVFWRFPEFPDAYPVKEVRVDTDRSVSFVWDTGTMVNITLEPQADGSTLVRVTEGGREYSVENLKWVIGIQLRKGAFDFMRKG